MEVILVCLLLNEAHLLCFNNRFILIQLITFTYVLLVSVCT